MKIQITLIAACLSLLAAGQTAAEKRRLSEKYVETGSKKHIFSDFNGAIEDFNNAIKVDPTYEVAYFCRGKSEMMLGENKKSNEDLNKAIQLNPNYKEALYYSCPMDLSGIKVLDKIMSLDPTFEGPLGKRGLIKVLNNDFEGGCIDLYLARNIKDDGAQADIDQFCSKKKADFQSLSIPWLSGQNWKSVEAIRGEAASRTMLVGATESADKWTEKITMGTSQPIYDFTLNDLMTIKQNLYKSNNSMASLTVLEKNESAQYPYIVFTLESLDMSKTTKTESQLWYITQTNGTVYTNCLSLKKGMISAENRKKWSDIFKGSKIENR